MTALEFEYNLNKKKSFEKRSILLLAISIRIKQINASNSAAIRKILWTANFPRALLHQKGFFLHFLQISFVSYSSRNQFLCVFHICKCLMRERSEF